MQLEYTARCVISKQGRIAGTLGAETEVVTDQEPAHGAACHQHVVDERARSQLREAAIEVRNERAFDTAALERGQFVTQVEYPRRRALGRKEFARMRLETHHSRYQTACASGGDDAAQQRLMAAVNTVEIADRQGARNAVGRARSAAINLHKNAVDAMRKTTAKYTVERRIILICRAFGKGRRAHASTIRAVMKPRADNPVTKPIVVLVSGRGSNLQALLATEATERWQTELGAKIVAVIGNRADAEALDVARSNHVPVHILAHADFGSRAAFDDALARAIDRYAPQLIVLAGFMRVLTPAFVRRYAGRLINVHPSLLPSFPGLNTHQRALDAGVRVHGATVHFVSDEIDAGPIIAQAAVAVHAGDDAASLAARVLQQEHRLLPQAVRHVLEGRVQCCDRRAVLTGIEQGELSLLAS